MGIDDLVDRLERLLTLYTEDFLINCVGDSVLKARGLGLGAQSPAVGQTIPFLVFLGFATPAVIRV